MITGDIEEAAKVLNWNGVIVHSTETVYGLGANTLSEKAIKIDICGTITSELGKLGD